MKRFCIFATLTITIPLAACDPLTDDQPMGAMLSPEQLDIEVINAKEGSNAIILRNNTPRTAAYWDIGLGVSTRQRDTVIMPYIGDAEAKFIGMCNGGQVEIERSVHINQIDHPIQKKWISFAGNGAKGKTWTQNFDNTDEAVYGTGGWLTRDNPSWDVKPLSRLEDRDRSLVFDLNGGANVTKADVNGKVPEKGHFSFDMAATKVNPNNGRQWSIGQLTLTGVTMLSGHVFYGPDKKITMFEILKLTDKGSMLYYDTPDTEVWNDVTLWMLCVR